MGETNNQAINIVLCEGVHPGAKQLFTDNGFHAIEYHEKALPAEQLKQSLQSAHIIGIRSRTQLTAEVLSQAPNLMAIGCFCIGTNQVDLEAAANHGVPVFNAPFANTRSVAELVLAEMILLLRGVPEKSAKAHQGIWLKSAVNSYETRGKTLGIVGYGHIGSQLSILAENLGMKVIYHDIENKLTLGNAIAMNSLEDLLKQADVITFHVPQTEQTKNLLNVDNIKLVKQGAIVINASRGTVIEIEALCAALQSGQVAGAAIDVYPVEPKSTQEEFQSPLRAFDNVILTPHIGGSTQEAQANIGIEVAEKLVKYLNNGSTFSSVNFPEAALPELADKHRICHIHQNEPGILSAINNVFSQHQINIAGQYLQTRGNIGYVVTDLDKASSEIALEDLKKIQGTIQARILY